MMCSDLRKIKQGHLSWMVWEGFSEEGALELRLNEGKEPFTPRSKNFLDREWLVQTSWCPGCGGGGEKQAQSSSPPPWGRKGTAWGPDSSRWLFGALCEGQD